MISEDWRLCEFEKLFDAQNQVNSLFIANHKIHCSYGVRQLLMSNTDKKCNKIIQCQCYAKDVSNSILYIAYFAIRCQEMCRMCRKMSSHGSIICLHTINKEIPSTGQSRLENLWKWMQPQEAKY